MGQGRPARRTTEGGALNDQRSVLIVDRSEETREVLQAVLERRGVRTLAAGKAKKGLELARQHRPDLIVLDLDLDDTPAEQFSAVPCRAGILPGARVGGSPAGHKPDRMPVLAEAAETPAPQEEPYQPRLVLLGSLRGLRDRLPEGEFVSKPYHYGPLIRRIEELLARREGDGSNWRDDRASMAPAVGPCRQIEPVPFSLAEESGPCRRCSSFAEPTRAAASS
jgi:CheY-like chemotaxis protein